MRLALALRFPGLAAAAILATSAPALAQVREEIVRFDVDGQTVVGTLTLPDSAERAPVVLMLFGFLGERAEWPIAQTEEGPYARAARTWAEAGYASLRIDYRGSGESDGSFAEASVGSEVADAIAAVAFLKAEARVNADRLGIVGWSLGGLVAASLATQVGDVDALVLWNAVATPAETFTGLFGAEVMAAGLEDGAPLDITMPWGQPIALGRQMIADLQTVDPVVEIGRYAGALLVAQGNADTIVSPEGASLYIEAHAGVERLWTADMDHMFNMEQGPEGTDALIAETLDFFAENLR